jgi:hypothetical protein
MFIGKFSTIALCLLALCGNAAGGTISVTFTGTLTEIFSTSGAILGTAEATFVLDPSLLSAPNDTETITDFSLDVDIFSPSPELESVDVTPDSTTPCFTANYTCFPSASASVDSAGQGITVSIGSTGCLDYDSFFYPAPYCAYPDAYQLFLSYPFPFNGNELIPAPPGDSGTMYYQENAGTGAYDNIADDSSVVGSPEPYSIVLMGCGVAALAFLRLRRSPAWRGGSRMLDGPAPRACRRSPARLARGG